MCVAYAPALRAPLIFDDGSSITENASIRRLWPLSVPLQPPGGGRAVSGRPVVNYSLAIDYAVNSFLGIEQRPGKESAGRVISYRVTNILLHLLCGALLFGVLDRTVRSLRVGSEWTGASVRIAGLTTAIWVLHPLQSEAVNYVVQRTELLVSMFWLATLYASIRAWDASVPGAAAWWRAVAVGTCVLGMGSKEVMVGAPIAIVLYDRAFRVPSWRDLLRARERLWFYALLLATTGILVWSISSGARADSAGLGLGMPWYRYLYSQGWAIGHYLRLVLWPNPLSIDYGATPVSGIRPLPGLIVVAMCGVATLWAWTRVARWGWLAFAGAWFFLLLAPSSSFVPVITEIAAERRIYLALAAVVLVLVVGVEAILRRLAAGSEPQRVLASQLRRRGVLIAVGICGLFTAVTFKRSVTFAHPEELWREDVKAWPQNARGYNNLGMTIAEEPSRYAEAEDLFTRAIELDSTMASAWIDLAYVRTKEGRLSDAEVELRHALTSTDRTSRTIAVERYGRTLLGMGDLRRGIPYLERAALERANDENFFWLGAGYLDADRPGDAASALRRCLSFNPEFPLALRYLGRALIEGGHAPDAIPYLQAAVVREPTSAANLALLSLAFAMMERPQDALEAAAASARVGSDAESSVFAGRAMMYVHHPREAQGFFAQAVRFHPDDWVSLTRLGLADADLGDATGAAAAFRQALTVQPGYEPAREALARLRGRP